MARPKKIQTKVVHAAPAVAQIPAQPVAPAVSQMTVQIAPAVDPDAVTTQAATIIQVPEAKASIDIPRFEEFYAVMVDYITAPGGVPISKERVSRTEIYQAGLSVEHLLNEQSIRPLGRMEV